MSKLPETSYKDLIKKLRNAGLFLIEMQKGATKFGIIQLRNLGQPFLIIQNLYPKELYGQLSIKPV